MLSIVTLLASALILTAASGHGSIVACDWEGSNASTFYRFTEAEIFDWDQKAWQWKSRACTDGGAEGIGTPSCKLSVTDESYSWHLWAYDAGLIPDSNQTAEMRFDRKLEVDRQTGAAVTSWSSFSHIGRFPPREQKSERKGTCKKAEDPSLKPKPRPNL